MCGSVSEVPHILWRAGRDKLVRFGTRVEVDLFIEEKMIDNISTNLQVHRRDDRGDCSWSSAYQHTPRSFLRSGKVRYSHSIQSRQVRDALDETIPKRSRNYTRAAVRDATHMMGNTCASV
jgi:hypothetical protein